jgi:Phage integrase family
MSLVELKGVGRRLRPPRILTEEEFVALLNQLLQPYRSMVLLAGCTGLRISEVLGLRWQSVDFERLVMIVKEGYTRSQITKLKSEYSQDELPLDLDVATILLEWKRLCPATTGDWIFPSPRTNKPYDSSSLRKKVLTKTGGAAGKDSWIDWLARAAPQLSRLAGRNWSSTGCPAEADATREHFNHHECVWWRVHGSEAQGKHVGCTARSLPKSVQIAKGRLCDGLCGSAFSLKWTILD